MIRRTITVLLALTACSAPDASARDESARDDRRPTLAEPLVAAQGRCAVELSAWPRPPAMGELFAITARLACDGRPVEGARVAVRASMPEHGHGMVTRPVDRELGGGAYVSEGLKLHMPGRWELEVVADEGGETLRFRLPVEQPP
jgi:hypothetical protein